MAQHQLTSAPGFCPHQSPSQPAPTRAPPTALPTAPPSPFAVWGPEPQQQHLTALLGQHAAPDAHLGQVMPAGNAPGANVTHRRSSGSHEGSCDSPSDGDGTAEPCESLSAGSDAATSGAPPPHPCHPPPGQPAGAPFLLGQQQQQPAVGPRVLAHAGPGPYAEPPADGQRAVEPPRPLLRHSHADGQHAQQVQLQQAAEREQRPPQQQQQEQQLRPAERNVAGSRQVVPGLGLWLAPIRKDRSDLASGYDLASARATAPGMAVPYGGSGGGGGAKRAAHRQGDGDGDGPRSAPLPQMETQALGRSPLGRSPADSTAAAAAGRDVDAAPPRLLQAPRQRSMLGHRGSLPVCNSCAPVAPPALSPQLRAISITQQHLSRAPPQAQPQHASQAPPQSPHPPQPHHPTPPSRFDLRGARAFLANAAATAAAAATTAAAVANTIAAMAASAGWGDVFTGIEVLELRAPGFSEPRPRSRHVPSLPMDYEPLGSARPGRAARIPRLGQQCDCPDHLGEAAYGGYLDAAGPVARGGAPADPADRGAGGSAAAGHVGSLPPSPAWDADMTDAFEYLPMPPLPAAAAAQQQPSHHELQPGHGSAAAQSLPGAPLSSQALTVGTRASLPAASASATVLAPAAGCCAGCGSGACACGPSQYCGLPSSFAAVQRRSQADYAPPQQQQQEQQRAAAMGRISSMEPTAVAAATAAGAGGGAGRQVVGSWTGGCTLRGGGSHDGGGGWCDCECGLERQAKSQRASVETRSPVALHPHHPHHPAQPGAPTSAQPSNQPPSQPPRAYVPRSVAAPPSPLTQLSPLSPHLSLPPQSPALGGPHSLRAYVTRSSTALASAQPHQHQFSHLHPSRRGSTGAGGGGGISGGIAIRPSSCGSLRGPASEPLNAFHGHDQSEQPADNVAQLQPVAYVPASVLGDTASLGAAHASQSASACQCHGLRPWARSCSHGRHYHARRESAGNGSAGGAGGRSLRAPSFGLVGGGAGQLGGVATAPAAIEFGSIPGADSGGGYGMDGSGVGVGVAGGVVADARFAPAEVGYQDPVAAVLAPTALAAQRQAAPERSAHGGPAAEPASWLARAGTPFASGPGPATGPAVLRLRALGPGPGCSAGPGLSRLSEPHIGSHDRCLSGGEGLAAEGAAAPAPGLTLHHDLAAQAGRSAAADVGTGYYRAISPVSHFVNAAEVEAAAPGRGSWVAGQGLLRGGGAGAMATHGSVRGLEPAGMAAGADACAAARTLSGTWGAAAFVTAPPQQQHTLQPQPSHRQLPEQQLRTVHGINLQLLPSELPERAAFWPEAQEALAPPLQRWDIPAASPFGSGDAPLPHRQPPSPPRFWSSGGASGSRGGSGGGAAGSRGASGGGAAGSRGASGGGAAGSSLSGISGLGFQGLSLGRGGAAGSDAGVSSSGLYGSGGGDATDAVRRGATCSGLQDNIAFAAPAFGPHPHWRSSCGGKLEAARLQAPDGAAAAAAAGLRAFGPVRDVRTGGSVLPPYGLNECAVRAGAGPASVYFVQPPPSLSPQELHEQQQRRQRDYAGMLEPQGAPDANGRDGGDDVRGDAGVGAGGGGGGTGSLSLAPDSNDGLSDGIPSSGGGGGPYFVGPPVDFTGARSGDADGGSWALRPPGAWGGLPPQPRGSETAADPHVCLASHQAPFGVSATPPASTAGQQPDPHGNAGR